MLFHSSFLFFLITMHKVVECLILKGNILTTSKTWQFIGKFCFITEKGKVNMTIQYPASYAVENLIFYYDSQWPMVYPETITMTCPNKESFATPSQIFNLTSTTSGCQLVGSYIKCTTVRVFNLARPRYWFITVSRCFASDVSIEGLSLDYYFEMTNGDDPFHRQFSADEFGIFETSITFFLLYFIMVILGFVCARILFRKMLLHTTFRLFLLSIFFEFLSYLVYMCKYAQFSSNGFENQSSLVLARVFDNIAQILFLLMLILLAKGLNVTRGRLRTITTIKIVVLFIIYTIAIIVAFVYSEALFDPGLVNYFYNSPAGIAIIVIKLIFGWIWFIYSIFFTIKNYPEKRKFYITLVIYFSIWFWAGPLVIITCNYLVVDHVRQFVAFLIQTIIIFLGHFYFMVLTRPTAANKSFPYHIKTSQIGPLDNYPHHNENEGGNVNFNDVPNTLNDLSNIFVTSNQHKYQISDEQPSEKSN